MSADLDIGALTLVAAAEWKAASWPLRVVLWLTAPRQRYSHMGYRLCIGWRRDVPYLLSIREGAE